MLDAVVMRRYSDFVWLRDTLATTYPGIPVPPLKKKGNFKRYEDKYLFKKMLILEKFLNALVVIPELYSDILFEKFLTMVGGKDFEKLKSQYGKAEKLVIRNLKTLNGFVDVATEAKISNKVVKYQEYIKQTQPEIKK